MFGRIDRQLNRLTKREVLFIAIFGVGVVGLLDYLTGHELSFAFFYLGPVALAAWYSSRNASIWVSLAACLIWYLADIESQPQHSHPAIPVWNALVRLGFFLSNALLLTSLRKHLAAERHLARTDPMTGTLNRRAFTEQLEYSLALAERNASPLALAYVDLDDFKKVNDTQGHAEGDRALRAVARTLRNSSRRTDIVARLGGDEFAILLPETDLSGARNVMQEIKQQLDNLASTGGPGITCSVGAVVFPERAPAAAEAVKASDGLMYEVKRQGKNAILFGVYDAGLGRVVPVYAAEDQLPDPARPKKCRAQA